MLTLKEIAKHNTKESCWAIIHGIVYDLTEFLSSHPGGSKVILKVSGSIDATSAFDQIHSIDVITRILDPKCNLGKAPESDSIKSNEKEMVIERPNINTILNLYDIENVAKLVLSKQAWAYYSSGADDEITLKENESAYKRLIFIPRVMINVKTISTKTRMFGVDCDLPIYISATALGKLGHPDGEKVLTIGAANRNIIQMIPTLASCSFDSLVDAAKPNQTQWFQLYVNSSKTTTENIVRHVESRGIKVLCITVDAPTLGKREKDMRVKFIDDSPDAHEVSNRDKGAARAIASFIDPSLSWSDIAWFKSITRMKIVLKGIQCGQDAVLAAEAGCDGIIVSNHGICYLCRRKTA